MSEIKNDDKCLDIPHTENRDQHAIIRNFLQKSDYFLDTHTDELITILKTAPNFIQAILQHLKDPMLFELSDYRYCIFVGPPGSGKTTTAKAIAHALFQEGWDAHIICAGDILGVHRNETVARLRNILQNLVASSRPVIVIIDELNELLENAHDEHYDTSATAKFLWQFLDQQEKNHKFFLIGTMNDDTKLPAPFKSRIFLRRIEFKQLAIETALAQFTDRLSSVGIALANDITQAVLSKSLQQLSGASGRDMRELVMHIKMKLMIKACGSKENLILNQQSLNEAIKHYNESKLAIQYEKKNETKDEREERLFIQRTLIDLFIKQCTKTHYEHLGVLRLTYQEIPTECFISAMALFTEQQKIMVDALRNKSQKAIVNHREEQVRKAMAVPKHSPWYYRIFGY